MSVRCLCQVWWGVGKIQGLKIQILVGQGSGLHKLWDTGSESTFECVSGLSGFLGNMHTSEILVKVKRTNKLLIRVLNLKSRNCIAEYVPKKTVF